MGNSPLEPFFKSMRRDLLIGTRCLPGKNTILAQVHHGESVLYEQNFLMPIQIENEQDSSFYVAACQRLVADVLERMIELGQIKI